jgi:hypothetical protein
VASVDVGPVLHYAAEMSEVLAFLVVLPGACAAGRERAREHRRRDDDVHRGLAAAELQRQCLDDASSARLGAGSVRETIYRKNTLGVFFRL